jgi:hypothetical protein
MQNLAFETPEICAGQFYRFIETNCYASTARLRMAICTYLLFQEHKSWNNGWCIGCHKNDCSPLHINTLNMVISNNYVINDCILSPL